MTRALALAAVLFAAPLGCGGDDYGGAGASGGGAGAAGMGAGGAGGAAGAPAAGKFGARCSVDAECTEPMAFCGDTFDRSGKLCSVHCTTSADCPAGSMGQKCNSKGQCRP